MITMLLKRKMKYRKMCGVSMTIQVAIERDGIFDMKTQGCLIKKPMCLTIILHLLISMLSLFIPCHICVGSRQYTNLLFLILFIFVL